MHLILRSVLTLSLTILAAGDTLYGQDTALIRSLPTVVLTATSHKVPAKIWKGFETYFSHTANPEWYKINKNYLVRFVMNYEDNRALFTKKGELICHISYGYESSLDQDLHHQIAQVYPDFNITRAVKVTEGNRVVWVVNLEDTSTLVLLHLENGEMEEVQRLRKI